MTVLIVTRSDDNHCVERVIAALAARGMPALRFDTDTFPTQSCLSVRTDSAGHEVGFHVGTHSLRSTELSAVWYRRTHLGHQLPAEMDPEHRRVALLELQKTFYGMLASLPVFCIDPIPLVRQAEHKSLQLDLARRVGLAIPRTLTTNDPVAVRAFAAACPSGLVTKMLSSFAIHDANGQDQVVFTSGVRDEDLADLDGLSLCPMTFQERVPKALELRVTVCGYKIFSAAVDSSAAPDAADDWRRDGLQLADKWFLHQLPEAVHERVLDFMDQLGLNYGALDFILTPDGRYVFLEINPCGEFFWLEANPGFPISLALADLLLDNSPRRRPVTGRLALG